MIEMQVNASPIKAQTKPVNGQMKARQQAYERYKGKTNEHVMIITDRNINKSEI